MVVLGRWPAWGPSRPPGSNGKRVSIDPGSLEDGLAESEDGLAESTSA